MKKIFVLATIILGLFIVPSVFAEEQTLAGEVSLKGLLTNVKGSEAKFNEYRDLRDGVYGHAKLLYDTDAWWLKANVSDIGYDTQKYKLDGGMWGAFKADLFYQEIPHNTTFGAKSLFTGVGTGSLGFIPGGTVDPNDSATWPSSFDYSTKRRQLGGAFSLDILKPFFFNVSALTEEKKGNKPAGFLSTFGTPIELPERVDYRTNTVKTDFGYARNPLFLDVYFMYSDFNNKNDNLNVNDPLSGLNDSVSLPPDNKYYKVGFKGAVKLPLNSKFNINTGWSQTTSKVNLLTTDVFDFFPPATLSNPTFHGKVNTQNVDVALTTNPVSFLDGKLFYKYYNRDNKSDVISETDSGIPPIIAPQTIMNHLFDYQKNQYGGELGFRLPMKFYLNTGYTHVLTNRNLATLADTDDDIYSVELRWKGLSFLTARTGYERLVRNSDFHVPSPLATDPPINIDGARSFDLADKTRDSIKVAIDLYPTDFLSLGAGYKHKETNYRNLQYGLKSDRRDEVYTNADVMIGKYAQLFGYYDFEVTRRSQDQISPDVSNAAVWNLKDKETYYDFGVGTNIFLIPKKLTLRLQYDYVKSNGNADFTLSGDALAGANSTLVGTVANNSNIDIPNWDDYTKQSLMVKLIYDVTKHIVFSIGYAYEKFKYSDAQLDGYTLTPTTLGNPDAYLTGAYSNQAYKANLYFATMTYKFW